MAKFTKGQVAFATRFTYEPRWDEVVVVSCGDHLVKVAKSCPGTGYRVQVPVEEVHATQQEALEWLFQRAQERCEATEKRLATDRAIEASLAHDLAILRTPAESPPTP